jgi:hypothetical protein
MQLTEDNVQWPGLVLVVFWYDSVTCLRVEFYIYVLQKLDTPIVPEINSAANFCFRSFTTI